VISPSQPQVAASAKSDDPGLELAYTAAVKAVEQQDATLGNLRNRAAGLLSAVTIATTFAASLGLFSSDPARTMPLPDWSTWVLLALLIAVGALSIAVMWPMTMAYGVDARKVMAKRAEDPAIDSVRTYLINELVAAHERNQKAVVRKFHYYQGAIIALTVETAVLVFALILKG
jgi:hypothetical protein